MTPSYLLFRPPSPSEEVFDEEKSKLLAKLLKCDCVVDLVLANEPIEDSVKEYFTGPADNGEGVKTHQRPREVERCAKRRKNQTRAQPRQTEELRVDFHAVLSPCVSWTKSWRLSDALHLGPSRVPGHSRTWS
ncbi:hypothetical protein JZ751_015085, partial [Albula glossodonta]